MTLAARSDRRRCRLLIVALGLVSAACGSAGTQITSRPTGPGAVEGFMVVDCQLPGQIRQLGGQVTYVTARRAVKTSARDCEIRGGEYVAFDRANYATALKVWLPLAEQGDPAAQTYVGEIFEKGLGVQPDYATAATWYRRAADRGFSRAALNLGNLYERGLGVPRDPTQALNWYRRAAGSKEVDFEIAPAAATAEVAQLRAEVGTLRRELDAKSTELARVQGELDGARRTLDGRRSEVDAERRTVDQLRRELDETRRRETNAGARASRVAELERSISEREASSRPRTRRWTACAPPWRLETRARDQRERLTRCASRPRRPAPARSSRSCSPSCAPCATARTCGRPWPRDRPVIVGPRHQRDGAADVSRSTTAPRSCWPTTSSGRRSRWPGPKSRCASWPSTSRAGEARSSSSSPAPAAGRRPPPHRRDATRVGTAALGHHRRSARTHALVIGNNDYKLLRPLKTAVADAREVARVLEQDYGFQVRLLLNATRYDMLAALNELREKLTEKDNLLIYYAGHGELDERNQRGHWLPIDAEPNSTTNWISNVADHRRAQRLDDGPAAAGRRRLLLLRHADALLARPAGGRAERRPSG